MNKPLLSLICAVASLLPLAAERPLEPVQGEDELVRVWAIEGFHVARSADERVGVSIVVETVGHTFNSQRLLATFTADGPVEGDYLETTTFDLGRVGLAETPEFIITRISDRLYRLSFEAFVSDTLATAHLKFSHDLHLAEDGRLARVVPVHEYSSYWDMDGSKMGLVVSGLRRSIYYLEPKPGSGVKPGTLFFHGTKEGNAYRGKVLNWQFEGGLPSQDGDARVAEGEIRDDGATVVLNVRKTVWKNGEDAPVGPGTIHTLKFKSKPAPSR